MLSRRRRQRELVKAHCSSVLLSMAYGLLALWSPGWPRASCVLAGQSCGRRPGDGDGEAGLAACVPPPPAESQLTTRKPLASPSFFRLSRPGIPSYGGATVFFCHFA